MFYRNSSIALFCVASAFAITFLAVNVQAIGVKHHFYMPKEGFVPDEETAIHIAIAVLVPVYGEATVHSEEPFVATLHKGIWTVSGTVPKITGYHGGVATVEIAKKDARIIRLIHGK